MRRLLFVGFLSIATAALAQSYLPNAEHTPGATNPDISSENQDDTICAHGQWSTKSVRPSAKFTNDLKAKQLASYYKGQGTAKGVEEDHLIPLTLGGCPTCETNLWPQPRSGEHPASEKDRCEVRANKAVCAGDMSLADAQVGIAHDWVAFCKSIGVVK
jgi:hypothetical protein